MRLIFDPLGLECGRTPMGEFFVNVTLPLIANGERMIAPVQTYVMNEEEREVWHAASAPGGLILAKELPRIPKQNGHKES